MKRNLISGLPRRWRWFFLDVTFLSRAIKLAPEARDLGGLFGRRRQARCCRHGRRSLGAVGGAAPTAQHRGLDAKLGGYLHQWSTATLQQGRCLTLELVRECPSRFRHPTPSRSLPNLPNVSTKPGEDHLIAPGRDGTAAPMAGPDEAGLAHLPLALLAQVGVNTRRAVGLPASRDGRCGCASTGRHPPRRAPRAAGWSRRGTRPSTRRACAPW